MSSYFDEDGNEAPEPAAEDATALDMVRRATEEDVSRAHKTTISTREPGTLNVGPITDAELIAEIDRKPVIHRSEHMAVYMIGVRQVEVYIRATMTAYVGLVKSKLQLSAAVERGEIKPKILQPMTDTSMLGLFMVAAGRSWSPADLAKVLLVEDVAGRDLPRPNINPDRL